MRHLHLFQRRHAYFWFIFLAVNLFVAPAVYAATSRNLTQFQAYALGLLGLATLVYSIYLMIVMFYPERFS